MIDVVDVDDDDDDDNNYAKPTVECTDEGSTDQRPRQIVEHGRNALVINLKFWLAATNRFPNIYQFVVGKATMTPSKSILTHIVSIKIGKRVTTVAEFYLSINAYKTAFEKGQPLVGGITDGRIPLLINRKMIIIVWFGFISFIRRIKLGQNCVADRFIDLRQFQLRIIQAGIFVHDIYSFEIGINGNFKITRAWSPV